MEETGTRRRRGLFTLGLRIYPAGQGQQSSFSNDGSEKCYLAKRLADPDAPGVPTRGLTAIPLVSGLQS
jgi:hypothetical protein